MDEPDQVLRDFVFGLPDTIRGGVLANLCFAFDHVEARPGFDFPNAFSEILDSGRGSRRAVNLAKIIGVLEMLLEVGPTARKVSEALASEHEHDEAFKEFFEVDALKAPLKERHYERAREELQSLREGILSPASLQQWSAILGAEDPIAFP